MWGYCPRSMGFPLMKIIGVNCRPTASAESGIGADYGECFLVPQCREEGKFVESDFPNELP